MEKYKIVGGNNLDGKIEIKGAKNAVLPLLAASILTDEKVTLINCPKITDVDSMLTILNELGCYTTFQKEEITIDSSNMKSGEISSNLAKLLRSSIFLLGALLSKMKKAKVAYPGGCDIGLRPIDIHIQGLRELNISIVEENGYLICDATNAKSNEVILDLPSVGATENIMLASVFLKGTTVIRNCAKEPEIQDLQNFLNKMGANIKGGGTSTIIIEGVNNLHGIDYIPIPDRIALGTYIIMTIMCGGMVEFNNVNIEHIFSLISKLKKTTCKLLFNNGKMLVSSSGRPKSIDRIETMYYPGFPTDLQTQALAMQSISKGCSIVVENIFETRFRPVGELLKMGANITVKGKSAIVNGVERLHSSDLVATDLRGGASLVLAALTADGESTINDIYHIDRGYENLTFLKDVGARIKRIKNE